MVLSCAVLATRTQQSGATLCPYYRTSTAETSGRHTHNAKNIASIGFSNNNKLPTHRQKEIFRSETSKIDTKTRLPTSTARYFERARVILRMLKWVLFYTGSEVRAQIISLAELISFKMSHTVSAIANEITSFLIIIFVFVFFPFSQEARICVRHTSPLVERRSRAN